MKISHNRWRRSWIVLLGVTSYSKTSVQVPAANHSASYLTDTWSAANRKPPLVRRGQDEDWQVGMLGKYYRRSANTNIRWTAAVGTLNKWLLIHWNNNRHKADFFFPGQTDPAVKCISMKWAVDWSGTLFPKWPTTWPPWCWQPRSSLSFWDMFLKCCSDSPRTRTWWVKSKNQWMLNIAVEKHGQSVFIIHRYADFCRSIHLTFPPASPSWVMPLRLEKVQLSFLKMLMKKWVLQHNWSF